METYNKGESIKCPHCSALTEDPVEDYVVPNLFRPLRTACDNCYNKFTVSEIKGTDTFEVRK